jgi:ribosomal RNA-processing protein 36
MAHCHSRPPPPPRHTHKHTQASEKEAIAGGKKPFFLKKSEKRKRELLAKYEDLKVSGRLDKYMEKRRKKNAAKDHRYVPSSRRAGGE